MKMNENDSEMRQAASSKDPPTAAGRLPAASRSPLHDLRVFPTYFVKDRKNQTFVLQKGTKILQLHDRFNRHRVSDHFHDCFAHVIRRRRS
jgi:hypothetical protein